MACNPNGYISGKFGEFTIGGSSIAPFTDFNLNVGNDIHQVFTKSGAGWAQTVVGAASGEGTLNAIVDEDNLIGGVIKSGDQASLTVLLKTGVTLSGCVRIGKFNFTVNRDGTPQTQSIPFMTDGPLTGTPLGT